MLRASQFRDSELCMYIFRRNPWIKVRFLANPLPTQHHINYMLCVSEIRTRDCRFRVVEDCSCLKPYGHSDQRYSSAGLFIFSLNLCAHLLDQVYYKWQQHEATKSHSTFQIFNYYHQRDYVRNSEVSATVFSLLLYKCRILTVEH